MSNITFIIIIIIIIIKKFNMYLKRETQYE